MKFFLIVILLVLAATSVFAAAGTLHLIYDNGTTVIEADSSIYYEFDIQIWLSEGDEVLGTGMAYVDYPETVFGTLVITNNKVSVTKSGILYGEIPDINIQLYDVITNDTYSNCYAITFEAPTMGNSGVKQFFTNVSNNPLLPSDLMHVRMEVAGFGEGNVLFPGYIPGIENLYFNYESETFTGGLNISEAIEAVLVEDTTGTVDPDPVFTGSVELKSFTASWKRENILI
ncbi:MAG: hypothetical protein KAT14_06950, partial [Candidatus Marinimicrobia bacterium]|nr:hypothetical protein [Candidatus Neomarinimicrobiota bacterium]